MEISLKIICCVNSLSVGWSFGRTWRCPGRRLGFLKVSSSSTHCSWKFLWSSVTVSLQTSSLLSQREWNQLLASLPSKKWVLVSAAISKKFITILPMIQGLKDIINTNTKECSTNNHFNIFIFNSGIKLRRKLKNYLTLFKTKLKERLKPKKKKNKTIEEIGLDQVFWPVAIIPDLLLWNLMCLLL